MIVLLNEASTNKLWTLLPTFCVSVSAHQTIHHLPVRSTMCCTIVCPINNTCGGAPGTARG